MASRWLAALVLVGCGHPHLGGDDAGTGDDGDAHGDAASTDGGVITTDGGDCQLGCAMPPPATCNGMSVRTFDPAGTCQANQCAYGYHDTGCTDGCFDGACAPTCSVTNGWVDRVAGGDGSMISRNSAAVGPDGTIWIAYRDSATISLRLAHRAPNETAFTSEIVETSDVGWTGNNAIAIDSTGAIHIVHQNTEEGSLRYATRAAAPGSPWQVGRIAYGDGTAPSIAIDAHDGAHVVYYKDQATFAYAYQPANGAWTVHDLPFYGGAPMLRIAPDGSMHLVYGDSAVRYAHRATLADPFTIVSPAVGGTHGSLAIDRDGGIHIASDGGGAIAYSYLAPHATMFTGTSFGEYPSVYPAIAVEPSGAVHVSYISGYVGSTAHLHYAFKPPGGSFSSGEVPEIGYSQVGLVVTTFDHGGGVHITHLADHHLGTDLFLQDDYLDRSCM